MKTLSSEIEAVLLDYERRAQSGDISDKTLKAVKNAYWHLKQYWGDKEPKAITKDSWALFQDHFEKLHPGASQFNLRKMCTVLIKHLYDREIIPKKIQIQDRFARREKNQRRKRKNWTYSKEEINALDGACKDIKERIQLRLGYQLGFRISDVCNLTWERITLVEGKYPYAYVEFTGSDDKASTIARCPMPRTLLAMLLEIPKTSRFCFHQSRNPDKPLKTQQINFTDLKRRAGVKRGSFHSLRHYRLTTDCANPKLTLAHISKMRRVSVAVLMEHYVHTREEDMALMIAETK